MDSAFIVTPPFCIGFEVPEASTVLTAHRTRSASGAVSVCGQLVLGVGIDLVEGRP